jgi:hypothetical protein
MISGPVFHDVVKSSFIRSHLINRQTVLKTEPLPASLVFMRWLLVKLVLSFFLLVSLPV